MKSKKGTCAGLAETFGALPDSGIEGADNGLVVLGRLRHANFPSGEGIVPMWQGLKAV